MAINDKGYSNLLTGGNSDVERDIDTSLDTIHGLKGLYDTSIGRLVKGFDKAKSTKSIIGMAARNTFEFPVFISKSIPLDYATATNQLLEQLYASYVQAAISQNPIVDAKSVKHGGFLAGFQTNISKYVEFTDMSYAHEACHNVIMTESAEYTFDMIDITDDDAVSILENVDNTPLCEFNHFFVEGGGTGGGHGGNNTEEPRDKKARLDYENTDHRGSAPEPGSDPNDNTDYRRSVFYQRQKNKFDASLANFDNEMKNRREIDRRSEHKMKLMNRAPEVLKEEDMRKINSMKPLMMKIQMRVVNSKSDISETPIEFIVGIHNHARLIDADVLPDVVKYPLKEMNEITRRIKWKNGELKFMKDIVFQIKEKKQTAVDSNDPKKKWYRRLYELAHEKGDTKVSGAISGNGSTGLIPNATIMMSSSDVENIKAVTKLDIMKPGLAKKLCNELFLISLVVIDQDAESIKLFIPELHGDWEIHSLASVEKQLAELSTAGSKTRDLFKLLK